MDFVDGIGLVMHHAWTLVVSFVGFNNFFFFFFHVRLRWGVLSVIHMKSITLFVEDVIP